MTASLPAKRIGPLALKANLSGPGHYTLERGDLRARRHLAAPESPTGCRISTST